MKYIGRHNTFDSFPKQQSLSNVCCNEYKRIHVIMDHVDAIPMMNLHNILQKHENL